MVKKLQRAFIVAGDIYGIKWLKRRQSSFFSLSSLLLVRLLGVTGMHLHVRRFYHFCNT